MTPRPGDREIAMTRVFDAPAHLVFRGLDQARLVKPRLYGPDDWRLAVCEMDLRVGGAARFRMAATANGKEKDMGMSAFFARLRPPDRLVFTEIWGG